MTVWKIVALESLKETYCSNKLVHTIRSHTMEVCEVELQVDLVVEHVLA